MESDDLYYARSLRLWIPDSIRKAALAYPETRRHGCSSEAELLEFAFAVDFLLEIDRAWKARWNDAGGWGFADPRLRRCHGIAVKAVMDDEAACPDWFLIGTRLAWIARTQGRSGT